MKTRLLIGAVGVGAGSFGTLRFFQLDLPDILDAVLWLAGGVLLHDVVIAPLTIVLTVLATWVVPPRLRVRGTTALIVLATVTATAIPVLGRFGERPDNPTILARNYLLGWLVLAVSVLGAALLAELVAKRRSGGSRPRPARSRA